MDFRESSEVTWSLRQARPRAVHGIAAAPALGVEPLVHVGKQVLEAALASVASSGELR